MPWSWIIENQSSCFEQLHKHQITDQLLHFSFRRELATEIQTLWFVHLDIFSEQQGKSRNLPKPNMSILGLSACCSGFPINKKRPYCIRERLSLRRKRCHPSKKSAFIHCDGKSNTLDVLCNSLQASWEQGIYLLNQWVPAQWEVSTVDKNSILGWEA